MRKFVKLVKHVKGAKSRIVNFVVQLLMQLKNKFFAPDEEQNNSFFFLWLYSISNTNNFHQHLHLSKTR